MVQDVFAKKAPRELDANTKAKLAQAGAYAERTIALARAREFERAGDLHNANRARSLARNLL